MILLVLLRIKRERRVGAYSSEISSATILNTPTGLNATVNGNSIQVSWEPVQGATSYKVQVGTTNIDVEELKALSMNVSSMSIESLNEAVLSAMSVSIASESVYVTNGTSFTLDNISDEGIYRFNVKAFSDNSQSYWSSSVERGYYGISSGAYQAYIAEADNIWYEYNLASKMAGDYIATFEIYMLLAGGVAEINVENDPDSRYSESIAYGMGDALRHGLWSCYIIEFLIELFNTSISFEQYIEIARRLTTAYEHSTPNNIALARDMDFYNNIQSTIIAKNYYDTNNNTYFTENSTIIPIVKNKIEHGYLAVIDYQDNLVNGEINPVGLLQ